MVHRHFEVIAYKDITSMGLFFGASSFSLHVDVLSAASTAVASEPVECSKSSVMSLNFAISVSAGAVTREGSFFPPGFLSHSLLAVAVAVEDTGATDACVECDAACSAFCSFISS